MTSYITKAVDETIEKLGSMPEHWHTYSVDRIDYNHGIVEYSLTLYNTDNVEVAHVTITINETAQSIDVIKEIAR